MSENLLKLRFNERGCLVVALVTALCLAGIEMHAQAPMSARDLLKADRALARPEIARVVEAVRSEMAGKTFVLTGMPNLGGPRVEVLMGPEARERFVSSEPCCDTTAISEYTGRIAQTCKGAKLETELIVDYIWRPRENRWKASARQRVVPEMTDDYFRMLQDPSTAESGTLTKVGDRTVRLFLAPWKDRAALIRRDTTENTRQVIALDVETLLPLTWELVVKGASIGWGVTIAYNPSVNLGPPTGVVAPQCVG